VILVTVEEKNIGPSGAVQTVSDSRKPLLVRAALCRRCLIAVGHYFAYFSFAKLSPSSSFSWAEFSFNFSFTTHPPPPTTRESRETWNFASAGMPELAQLVIKQLASLD
jgi:hypothetical protein